MTGGGTQEPDGGVVWYAPTEVVGIDVLPGPALLHRFDLNPEYLDMASDRLRQLALQAGEEATV